MGRKLGIGVLLSVTLWSYFLNSIRRYRNPTSQASVVMRYITDWCGGWPSQADRNAAERYRERQAGMGQHRDRGLKW